MRIAQQRGHARRDSRSSSAKAVCFVVIYEYDSRLIHVGRSVPMESGLWNVRAYSCNVQHVSYV